MAVTRPEFGPTLPGRLREALGVLDRTGGLHASGLCTGEGGRVGRRPAANLTRLRCVERRGVRVNLPV